MYNVHIQIEGHFLSKVYFCREASNEKNIMPIPQSLLFQWPEFQLLNLEENTENRN